MRRRAGHGAAQLRAIGPGPARHFAKHFSGAGGAQPSCGSSRADRARRAALAAAGAPWRTCASTLWPSVETRPPKRLRSPILNAPGRGATVREGADELRSSA
jgi:hypothetical protein